MAKEEKTKKNRDKDKAPKAKRAAPRSFSLNVPTRGPVKVHGKVVKVGDDFEIKVKRPRSAKYEGHVIPAHLIIAAAVGENGYVVTTDSSFSYSQADLHLSDATTVNGVVTGTDGDLTVEVFPANLPATIGASAKFAFDVE